MTQNINKKMTQYAVIGLGKFGCTMATTLADNGMEVLAMDCEEEKVIEMNNKVTHAITADSSDEATLRAVDISSFDAVIIAIGDIQASILTSLNCKELGVKYVIAKAVNDKHKRVLEKIGVDYVIVPEAEMAYKLANKLIHPRLNDLMEISNNYTIAELFIPKSWAGKSLIELNVRQKYNVNVILVICKNGDINSNPMGDTVVDFSDQIIVGGINTDIVKFNEYINKII